MHVAMWLQQLSSVALDSAPAQPRAERVPKLSLARRCCHCLTLTYYDVRTRAHARATAGKRGLHCLSRPPLSRGMAQDAPFVSR